MGSAFMQGNTVDADRPTESEAFQKIITNVTDIVELLRETGQQSEQEGRLAPRALEALRGSGAMHMRVPAALGGPELSLVEQMKVLALLAENDSASAWCSMVANNGIGAISIYLSDEGVAEVFRDNPSPVGASVAAPGGAARTVEGGYEVEGTWRFCSNLYGADWVRCVANVDGDPDHPIMLVVPQRELRVLKTWNVTGLRGTGSTDFALDRVFVPEHRTADMRQRRQVRGERDYTRDVGGALAVYEHAAFAIGVARRSLSLLRTILQENPRRGGDREVVQDEYGRLKLEVDAAEMLTFSTFARIDAGEAEAVLETRSAPAVTTHVTELALRCALAANRRAGTQSLFLPNLYESTLRDMVAACAHALVTDRNYPAYGGNLLAGEASSARA
jgi:indole-3-acetate monooxygenase